MYAKKYSIHTHTNTHTYTLQYQSLYIHICIYRDWYCPWFQATTGGLGAHPPWIKEGAPICCISIENRLALG